MVGATTYKKWGADNKDREKRGEYCYEFFTASINDVCLILYYPVSALDHAMGGTIAAGGEGMESNVIEVLNMQQREKAAIQPCTQWTTQDHHNKKK